MLLLPPPTSQGDDQRPLAPSPPLTLPESSPQTVFRSIPSVYGCRGVHRQLCFTALVGHL